MPAPADIVREKLEAAVGWEWQEVEDLMELLIPMVPPGPAKRQYKQVNENYRRNNPDAAPAAWKQLNEDEQIASGARTIVNARIGSMIESGKLEVEREGDRRRVRLRVRTEVANTQGRCPTCNQHFPQATMKLPQPSSQNRQRQRRRNGVVVTRDIPQWRRQETA